MEGRLINARAIAEHLLLAARQALGRLGRWLAKDGRELFGFGPNLFRSTTEIRAEPQIIGHAHLLE